MLNLELGQEVYLCSCDQKPRSATVEELDDQSAWVSFTTIQGEVAVGKFWLQNGRNDGNAAYWITDGTMPN